MKIDSRIQEKATHWMSNSFDKETRHEVKQLMENNPRELIESFYTDLEFGTGGLRGIMGVGTNRMNKYTVGMATQGLANYVKSSFPEEPLKAAIAYDCRDNSDFFARITAEILSANGFEVYLFESLRPVPLLSFTIRHLGCHTGIILTASHNPKEYNGYKVYWNDGGQLVAPHDVNVINEVKKIKDVSDINFDKKEESIHLVGTDIDDIYIQRLTTLSLAPEIIRKHKDLKMVFTPIHGTSVKLVPQALKAFGFESVYNVPEQDVPDGSFSTVQSPNPEEPAALKMALDRAIEVNAELVMATDPDGDRVGVAVRNLHNEFVLLNGNQAAAIIIYYLLEQWKNKGLLKGKEYIVKTIVTSELLCEMAKDYKVECYDVLTGFKFIAEVIRKLEGQKKFIGGGEESYGYLIGDLVRDKDAVIACCIFAEATAWAKDRGLSAYELLIDVYEKYGFYKEKLVSITRKGKEGMEEIHSMMEKFRNQPPEKINNAAVVLVKDYQKSLEIDKRTHSSREIKLPKSNVIQLFLEDGSKITMRPSGTEPKIKFYFGVKGNLPSKKDFVQVEKQLDKHLDDLIKSLELDTQ